MIQIRLWQKIPPLPDSEDIIVSLKLLILFPNWQQTVEQILSKFLVTVPGGNEVARDASDASAVLSHLYRSSCVHTLWTLSSCQTVSVSHEHLCVLTSLSYSYRVVFLTVPPKFHAKKKSVVQLTRIFCTSRISWNRMSDWLLIFFHFGTENLEEQLKKHPVE